VGREVWARGSGSVGNPLQDVWGWGAADVWPSQAFATLDLVLARLVAANHNPAVWFWILLLIGSLLGFIQGVQAAAAGAQVCTYWKATGKLLDCDSGAYSAVLALVVGGVAVWRIYAKWKRSAATESQPHPGYDPSSVQRSNYAAATERGSAPEILPVAAREQTGPREATNESASKGGRVSQRSEPPMLVWPKPSPTDRHFPYKGDHYSLGLIQRGDASSYAIEDSGGIVEDFVYASDGWSAAWNRFLLREPGWKVDSSEERIHTPIIKGNLAGHSAETQEEGAAAEARRITYEIGREVLTPSGSTVQVIAAQDRIDWTTPDGGKIEPATGTRFCRVRVSLLNGRARDDIGLVADAFSLELADGSRVEPLDETYSPDELQGRYREYVEAGQRLEGWIYYELATAGAPTYALFDTGGSEDTTRPVIRWDLRPSRSRTAGAQYSLHVQSLGGADAVKLAAMIERYLEVDFPPDRLAVLPCTIVEGISYATAEPVRASLETSRRGR
jgi:hypothetical protein